MNATNTRLY